MFERTVNLLNFSDFTLYGELGLLTKHHGK